MSRSLALVKELLELVAEFDQKAGANEFHLPGFMHWLLQREEAQWQAMPDQPAANDLAEPWDQEEVTPDIRLTLLVTYLFRYAKHYTKKALEGSSLSTLDDFAFLVTLNFQGSLTKSELTNQHLLEITSGIEILKRLEKQGYVNTFNDPNDGRSKRVAITELGKGVMFELMGKMKQVSELVAGDLSGSELGQLLPTLQRLHHYHQGIHQQDKKSDLATLSEKYLNQAPA